MTRGRSSTVPHERRGYLGSCHSLLGVSSQTSNCSLLCEVGVEAPPLITGVEVLCVPSPALPSTSPPERVDACGEGG